MTSAESNLSDEPRVGLSERDAWLMMKEDLEIGLDIVKEFMDDDHVKAAEVVFHDLMGKFLDYIIVEDDPKYAPLAQLFGDL